LDDSDCMFDQALKDITIVFWSNETGWTWVWEVYCSVIVSIADLHSIYGSIGRKQKSKNVMYFLHIISELLGYPIMDGNSGPILRDQSLG